MGADSSIKVVIKSKREGKGRWYWLVDPQTEQWTSNRGIALKFERQVAEKVAEAFRQKNAAFDVRIEPAVLTQVRP